MAGEERQNPKEEDQAMTWTLIASMCLLVSPSPRAVPRCEPLEMSDIAMGRARQSVFRTWSACDRAGRTLEETHAPPYFVRWRCEEKGMTNGHHP